VTVPVRRVAVIGAGYEAVGTKLAYAVPPESILAIKSSRGERPLGALQARFPDWSMT